MIDMLCTWHDTQGPVYDCSSNLYVVLRCHSGLTHLSSIFDLDSTGKQRAFTGSAVLSALNLMPFSSIFSPSGPVTAGVLRGDKARFQLFGEVVNITSQLEATSKPGRIQVSPDTADLLVQAGWTTWLEKRPGKMLVRGKGNVQTYWLTSKERSPGSVASADSGGMDWAPTMGDLKGLDIDSKSDRLVEWNTEQLLRLLKEIEARRRLLVQSKSKKKLKKQRVRINGNIQK